MLVLASHEAMASGSAFGSSSFDSTSISSVLAEPSITSK